METLYSTTEDSYNSNKPIKNGGEVSKIRVANHLNYPHVMMYCDSIDTVKAKALGGILEPETLLPLEDNMYRVYINFDDSVLSLGSISAVRLKTLLTDKVFNFLTLKVFLSKDSVLEGQMLFALCQSSSV